jgi:phage gp36-like protein
VSYSTDADLNFDVDLLAKLTDTAAAVNVVNQAEVDARRLDATAMIHKAIQGKYVVPVTGPQEALDTLRLIERDLRRGLHFRHRPTMDCPKQISEDYNRALADLAQLGQENGSIVLNGAARVGSADVPPQTGSINPTVERQFGRDRDRLG